MTEGCFRLAHFTDAHLPTHGRFRLAELAGKRGFGALNWLRARSRQHLMAVADALAADIAVEAPDHIAMTGDAVNFGLAREYDAAAAWLARLSAEVSFVPGNHEALTAPLGPDFAAAFAPFMTGDDGRADAPYLRRRGPLAVIGLSSAIPSPPFCAYGRLGAAQCGTLRTLLAETRGLFRLVMIHHPPCPTTPDHRGLKDRADLAAAIAQEGAELILYGHNHRAELASLPGPDQPVAALAAPSASTPLGEARPPAEWRMIEIAEDEGRWVIDVTRRALTPKGEFAPRGRFRLTAPRPRA